MKVSNMTSPNGNKVANQFIIEAAHIITGDNKEIIGKAFQSYNSVIAVNDYTENKTYLDSYYWDYSVTTGKYRNIFLGENKAETQKKIDSGEYILTNLN